MLAARATAASSSFAAASPLRACLARRLFAFLAPSRLRLNMDDFPNRVSLSRVATLRSGEGAATTTQHVTPTHEAAKPGTHTTRAHAGRTRTGGKRRGPQATAPRAEDEVTVAELATGLAPLLQQRRFVVLHRVTALRVAVGQAQQIRGVSDEATQACRNTPYPASHSFM